MSKSSATKYSSGIVPSYFKMQFTKTFLVALSALTATQAIDVDFFCPFETFGACCVAFNADSGVGKLCLFSNLPSQLLTNGQKADLQLRSSMRVKKGPLSTSGFVWIMLIESLLVALAQ
jgi:hypothetical protein